jgi:putative oxidoreductase
MSTIAAVIGRILLAIIFIVSGANKLMDVPATEQMITSVGMPGGLAIPTGIFEVVLGLCLALGLMTRLAAILLAGFTLIATVLFHAPLMAEDPMQAANTMKNLAIVGGLLLVFAHSQIWWSWDSMRKTRRGEVAARDAEARAHDAELRAARAEGAVGASRTAPGGRVVTDVDRDGVPEVRKRRWF